MILKAFREKSNKDYVNRLLEKRANTVNELKIRSVAVLLNHEEFDDAESFRSYFKDLNLLSPRNKVVYYSELEAESRAQWETYFTKKDFGWKGKIKNIELEQFLNESFDLLIGYYNNDIHEMHQIMAMSNANFKVGIHNHDERLFDLILNIDTGRIDLFKIEFKKYLTILNKL